MYWSIAYEVNGERYVLKLNRLRDGICAQGFKGLVAVTPIFGATYDVLIGAIEMLGKGGVEILFIEAAIILSLDFYLCNEKCELIG